MDIFRLPTHNTLWLLLATYGYPLVGGEERVVVADDAEVLHLDPGHLCAGLAQLGGGEAAEQSGCQPQLRRHVGGAGGGADHAPPPPRPWH